jgi:hypothetical protein
MLGRLSPPMMLAPLEPTVVAEPTGRLLRVG